MKRMTLVKDYSSGDEDGGGGGGVGGGGGIGGGNASQRHKCDNCRADFPNKTTAERHMLFCKTLADIRRGSGGSGSGGGVGGGGAAAAAAAAAVDDPLMPTQREMFILIQELAAKYNKVKDELDVMKQWAKMVGRRIGTAAASSAILGSGGSGGAGAASASFAGLDFTSVGRQKRQNMEVILNEEDEERPDLAELRPAFSGWLASPDLANTITSTDLNVVFNEDLIAGIAAAILRVLAGYTAESGRSHLVPFKLADIKQGAFYIYDTPFSVAVAPPPENGPDLPTTRKWRAMEPCEFQLLVRTFHKLLFKEFKKWQDLNWEAQRELTKQRQKAASSYQQMMSGAASSSSGAASVDGDDVVPTYDDTPAQEPTTPVGGGGEPVLSEDFATLYNKYADKMMGGALSDETILTRVRAKLWKDMKAWRL
jgi:hypothetical protein